MVRHLTTTTVRDIRDLLVHGAEWEEVVDAIAERAAAHGGDIHGAAAEWVCGLVREEPFATDNHPVAVYAAAMLFEVNSWQLDATDESLDALVRRAAEDKEVSVAELAAELAALAHRVARARPSSPR